jgi:hypothetical protein
MPDRASIVAEGIRSARAIIQAKLCALTLAFSSFYFGGILGQHNT